MKSLLTRSSNFPIKINRFLSLQQQQQQKKSRLWSLLYDFFSLHLSLLELLSKDCNTGFFMNADIISLHRTQQIFYTYSKL